MNKDNKGKKIKKGGVLYNYFEGYQSKWAFSYNYFIFYEHIMWNKHNFTF